MTKFRYIAMLGCISLIMQGYCVAEQTTGYSLTPAQRQQLLTQEHLTDAEVAESPKMISEEQNFKEHEERALSLLSPKNQLAYRMLSEMDRQDVVHQFRKGKDPQEALISILSKDQRSGRVGRQVAFGSWSKSPSNQASGGQYPRSWEADPSTNNAMVEKRMRMMDQRMQMMEKKLDLMEHRMEMMNSRAYNKGMKMSALESETFIQHAAYKDTPCDQMRTNYGGDMHLRDDVSLPMDQRMQMMQQRMQLMQQKMDRMHRQLQKMSTRSGSYGGSMGAQNEQPQAKVEEKTESTETAQVDENQTENAVTEEAVETDSVAQKEAPTALSPAQKSMGHKQKSVSSWKSKMDSTQKSWNKKMDQAQQDMNKNMQNTRDKMNERMSKSRKSMEKKAGGSPAQRSMNPGQSMKGEKKWWQ